MMPKECAILKAFDRAKQLQRIIEQKEEKTKCHDNDHRDELGMLRYFLLSAGIEKSQLPETPFVVESYVAKYREIRDSNRAAREKRLQTPS